MLTDFFDTMGTVTGVAAEAGLAERGRLRARASGASCSSTRVAAIAGGAAGICSNTTYIESAAGVAEGGRTGLTSVVTGVLFLLAILLSPLAAHRPVAGDRAGPGPRRLPDVHARSRTSTSATSRTGSRRC